jgi:hypothetical protein
MATAAYMTGRKRYQRPEAILWSNNSGTLTSGLYVPNGYEVGAVVIVVKLILINKELKSVKEQLMVV